jgi:A/G-specific adenine glycosylase
VAEVMLQQTQAVRVVAPYGRFLDRFPTPSDCAVAPVAEVVRAWDGLGYNRRARDLHRAAGVLVDRHGGAVPDDLEALLALPGVGRYTARAVLAQAHGRAVVAVDTNVGRVLARAVAGRPLRPSEAQTLADALVPAGASWEFAQALFDLGASRCTARAPTCPGCPLGRLCAWRRDPGPDPAPASAGAGRPQSRFAGSDRQGRGRLVAALRRGPLPRSQVAAAAGWPDDPGRARQVAGALVAEGLVRRGPGGTLRLA